MPKIVAVLGGVHATFMYQQVLSEAPWVDVIVRGEGEEIVVNLVRAIGEGRWPADRRAIKGLAYPRHGDNQIVATEAAPDGQGPRRDQPRTGASCNWEKYIYVPLDVRVAIPNMARGCPFTCSFCSQWKFWRDYRVRDPKKVVDEIEKLVNEHDVGFFILADEEPTINRKKFTEFCEELIARGLPDKVKWGINTRVTDIYRDRNDAEALARGGPDARVASAPKPRPSSSSTASTRKPRSPTTRRRSACCAKPTSSPKRSSSSASTTRPRRRWKKPIAWRWTGSRTSPTGRCTRPGRSRRCSRNCATRSRCSTSTSTTSSRRS